MIMKQTKISYWLKGMTILLAVMGIFFFGALTAYAFQLKAQGNYCGAGSDSAGISQYCAISFCLNSGVSVHRLEKIIPFP